MISSVTGGCPEIVAIAVSAAQRAVGDAPVTKVVADAVHAHQVVALRSMNADEQSLLALAHFWVGGDLDVLTDLIGSSVDAGSVLDRFWIVQRRQVCSAPRRLHSLTSRLH